MPVLMPTVHAEGPDPDIPEHLQSHYQDLLETVQREGEIRVIVGLDVSVRPEGKLARLQSRIQQREKIRLAQTRMLDALQQGRGRYNVNRQYKYTSAMALTVDEPLLQQLITNPLVRQVSEDKLMRPVMTESNPLIGSAYAWNQGYDGSGWSVAILDTGVETYYRIALYTQALSQAEVQQNYQVFVQSLDRMQHTVQSEESEEGTEDEGNGSGTNDGGNGESDETRQKLYLPVITR